VRLLQIAKWIGGPGSAGFLIAAAAVGLAWIRWRPAHRRAGVVWLWAVAAVYLLLAVPMVAAGLADALPRVATPPDIATADIQTLFILDGDNREGRIAEAQRLCRRELPDTIWLLAARFMRDDLIMVGVPRSRIRISDAAATTEAQLAQVQRLLRRQPTAHAAVLASRLQIARVAAVAAQLHLDVLLVGSPLDRDLPARGLGRFAPSLTALAVSRDAIYEHAALVYYRWRGYATTSPAG
jgi:uncharacterized SAM-binding protein YcdF (DUF218 family)